MPRKKNIEEIKVKEKSKEYYLEAVGRRKTAVARVRIYPQEQVLDFLVNEKKLNDYFPLEKYRLIAQAPFEAVKKYFKTTVKVKGGGVNAQAEAIRHGLARVLVSFDNNFKSILKPLGYLTRDPRMVERKHPGLRKARRAQQWRKR